jgi:hypothetical protein
MGVRPTNFRKCSANRVRDVPVMSARCSSFQGSFGASCIAVSALARRGSASPASTPVETAPLPTTWRTIRIRR